jgi:hypothetical protein
VLARIIHYTPTTAAKFLRYGRRKPNKCVSTVGWGKRSEPQHSHPSHAHTAIAGGALFGDRLVAGHGRAKSKKGLRAGQRWASAYHRKTMAEPGLTGDTVGIARKRLGA